MVSKGNKLPTKFRNVKVEDKLYLINSVYKDVFSCEPILMSKLRQEKDDKKGVMKYHIFYDILDNLMETWSCVGYMEKNIGEKCNKESYLINMHGFMQCIYVHQDILEELLEIFQIGKEDIEKLRKQNRTIRNELTGHPISITKSEVENNNKIKSTAVWCWGSKIGKIKYLFRPEGDFGRQEKRVYDLKVIIDEHIVYVNKCLDLVLDRMQKILQNYTDKKIKNIINLIEKKEYKKVIELTVGEKTGLLKSINITYGYYTFANLCVALKEYNAEERYKFFIDGYINTLCYFLKEENIYEEKISKIEELLSSVVEEVDRSKLKVPKIEFTYTIVNPDEDGTEEYDKKTLEKECSYFMSKLSEKRYYSDITVLEQILHNYPDMLKELQHMRKYWTEEHDYETNIEYYSAYLYLKHLILKKDEEILKNNNG